MPKAAPLEDALAKKGGLTLSQLVDYDDRLTDALVDRVCAVRVSSHHTVTDGFQGILLDDHPQTPPRLPCVPRSAGGRCVPHSPGSCRS